MAARKKRLRIRQSPKLPAGTRREQLLQAARVQFIRRGYRATTTEAIARRAGLTKGALYFHFKSKEEIFSTLVKQAADRLADAFELETDKRLSPGDVLTLLHRIDAGRDVPRTRHSLNLRAEALKLPTVRGHVNKAVHRITEVVAGCLNPKYGRTKVQRRRLAILTLAVYDGLALAKQISPDLIDIDEQIRGFDSLFVHMTKKPTEKRG